MWQRLPCATRAPSRMDQEVGFSVAVFQPLNVLPSKICTKPSSDSAAGAAAKTEALRATTDAMESKNRFMSELFTALAKFRQSILAPEHYHWRRQVNGE